jgi:protein ImuB
LRNVPVIVRERIGSRDLVRACSEDARKEGVTRGMRRREAEARCPEAVCVDADEPNEARTFEVVARAIEAFTPRVVLERPGRCEFPTRGPARYFGGDELLAERVHDAVAAELGDDADVRIGIADGAFTAWCAARKGAVVPSAASAAFLAPWPVTALGDDALADLLNRLGLRTLGDVAALPLDSVIARFGNEGRAFHELARGVDPGPAVLETPPPDLVEQIELDPPAERVDQAAFAAKGLADRLLDQLAARGLACTRVLIEAETEHGERLTRCWRADRELTPRALSERVRWQLDGWITTGETTAGIALLRLAPDEVAPAHGRQLGFWGGDQLTHDRADRAFGRVQGLLGYDAVVTAVPQGGRTPAEQVRWVPWGEAREAVLPLDAAWPGSLPAPYPARVFDPPLPAEVVDEHGAAMRVSGRGEQLVAPARLTCAALPNGGGAVRAWAGPWAHDVRWWDMHARQRCVRWQLVVGSPGDEIACVVVIEGGRAGVEAVYD